MIEDTFLVKSTRWYRRAALAVLLIALALIVPFIAHASVNSGVTYHGRIVKPDGTALQGATVQFQLQIRSPGSENCLLYEEVQTLNMLGSDGVFSLTLNDGSGTRLDSSGYQFDTVFSNQNTFTLTSSACATGSAYTPNAGDGRSFVISFRDETMSSYEALPAQPLNFAPIAIQAKYVDGYGPQNLLRFDGTVTSTSPLNNTQYNALVALVNGTSTQYTQSATNGATELPVLSGAPTGATKGEVWYDSTTNTIEYNNGSGTQTLGAGGGSGISALTGDVTASGTGSVAATVAKVNGVAYPSSPTTGTVPQITAANVAAYTSTPSLGVAGTASGSLALANGASGGAAVTIANPAATSSYNFNLPATAGTAGYALVSGGGGNSPMTWVAMPSASGSSSITNLGTVTSGTWNASTITVPYGGTGVATLTAHGVVVGEGSSPIAVSVGSAGTLLQGNGASSDPTFTASPTLGVNGSATGSLGLASAGGATTTIKPNAATAAAYNFVLPVGPGTSGYVLQTDGAGNTSWVAASSGTGTVNSGTSNQLAYYSSSGAAVSGLSSSASSVLITNSSNVPAWSPLSNDNFTQYALLAGRSGGQTLYGDTTAGGKLTLDSTSNATKGIILLAPSGGNVGVGTTSPGGSFEIDNNTAVNPTLIIKGAPSQANNLITFQNSLGTTISGVTAGGRFVTGASSGSSPGFTFNADGASGVFQPTSSTVAFSTGGTERVRVDSSGNVGIGTTTPTATLQVRAGTATAGTAPLKLTAGTNLTTPEAGAIEFDGTSLYFTNNGGTRQALSTSASASQWTTSGSNISYVAGNVGIGSSTPNASLEVVGSGAAPELIVRNTTNQGYISLKDYSGGEQLAITAGSGNADLSPNGGVLTFGKRYASGGYGFNNASTNLMTINGLGNVGIGTTTPTAKLNIAAGTAALAPLQLTAGTVLSTPLSGAIEFDGTNLYYTNSGGTRQTLSTSASSSQWTTTGSNIYYSTGNVGIGTSTPNAPLDVNGTALVESSNTLEFANSNMGISSNGYNYLYEFSWGNLNLYGDADNSGGEGVDVYAGAAVGAGSPILSVRSSGVGIGSTNPIYNLDVAGKMRVTSTALFNGGNVGIGTTSPLYELHAVTSMPAGTTPMIAAQNTNSAGKSSIQSINSSGAYTSISINGSAYPVSAFANAAGWSSANVTKTVFVTDEQTTSGGTAPLQFITGGYNNNPTLTITAGNTGNVGIGTSSPTAKLNIAAGTAALAPLQLTAGTVLSTPLSGAIEFDGTNLYYTNSGGTRQTLSTSGGGSFTNVTSISDSTGNITLAPQSSTGAVIVTSGTASTSTSTGALQITGGVGVSGAVNAGTSVTAGTSMITPQIYGSTLASGNVKIDGTSNATAGNVLLATAGGNVGVGTATPNASLDVWAGGEIQASANGYSGFTANSYASGTGVAGAMTFHRSEGSFAAQTYPLSGDWLGSINFRNQNNATTSAAIIGQATENQSATSDGGSLSFQTAPNGSQYAVTRMYIDNTGNVGIGTTVSPSLLTVNGGISSNSITSNDANFWGLFSVGQYGASVNYNGSNVFSVTGNPTGGGNYAMQVTTGSPTTSAYAMKYQNSNGTIGYVDNSGNLYAFGNVGVGTTSLTAKLNIAAGSATSAPLQLNAGTVLSTPLAGAIEFDGTSLYYTNSGGTRQTLSTSGGGSFTNVTSISDSTGNITLAPQSSTGAVVVTSGTASTSTSTGALQITGGVGVSGAVNANIFASAAGTAAAPAHTFIADLMSGMWQPATSTVAWSTAGIERMRITSSGSIGIGTTSPIAPVDVNGAVRATGFTLAGAGYFTNSSSAIVINTAGNTAPIEFQQAGVERFRVDTTGNVGIGTTSVTSLLTVGAAGGSTRQSVQLLEGGVGTPSYDGAYSSGDKFIMWNGIPGALVKNAIGNDSYGLWLQSSGNPSAHIGFWTGATQGAAPHERMRIDSSGNVGIGTTAPTAVLNIASGTAALAPLQLTAGTILTTPLSGAIEFDGTNLYYTDSTATRHTISSSGGTGAQTFTGDVTMSGSGTGLAVTNAETVGTTLGVTGLTTMTGGFTSAGAAAITNATTSTSTTTGAETIAGGLGVAGSVNANIFAAAAGTMAAPSHTFIADLTSGMWQPSTSSLAWSTGGVEHMRILTSGYVGIGTTNPSVPLHLQASSGGMVITKANDPMAPVAAPYISPAASTGFSSTIPVYSFWYQSSTGITNPANSVMAIETAGTERVRFDGAGNVGIGTVSPNSKLELAGANIVTAPTTYGNLNVYATNAQGADVGGSMTMGGYIDNAATSLQAFGSVEGRKQTAVASGTGGYLAFKTSALSNAGLLERMRINSSGSVGIGTTSPTYPFSVVGSASSGYSLGAAEFANSASDTIVRVNNTTAGGHAWGLDSAGTGSGIGVGNFNIIDATAATSRFSITTLGNVGIGTPNPITTLQARAGTDQNLAIASYGSWGYANGMSIASINDANSSYENLALDAATLILQNNGFPVGIGVTSPAYTLQVNGSVAGTSAYVNTSDQRLKKNIETIPSALAKITRLRGVTFDWRKDEHPEMKFGDRQELGVIAQEVEKIFPQAVSVDKNTGFRSVAYSMLIGPLIEAVKELNTRLEGLLKVSETQSRDVAGLKTQISQKADQAEIAELKRENTEVKAENAAVKAYLCAKDPAAPFCK